MVILQHLYLNGVFDIVVVVVWWVWTFCAWTAGNVILIELSTCYSISYLWWIDCFCISLWYAGSFPLSDDYDTTNWWVFSFSLWSLDQDTVLQMENGNWYLLYFSFQRYCKALDGYNFQKCCSIHKSLQIYKYRYFLILLYVETLEILQHLDLICPIWPAE